MSRDLQIIKKKYGEEFMHYCRQTFPIILETPGLLSKLIIEHFEPNKQLFKDIKNQYLENSFKNYIYNLIEIGKKEIKTDKTPKELLDEAGYYFFECKTEEDIQQFRKYYFNNEELCTFKGGRLDRCHVFWVVKKNVAEIKRENFNNPQREDEYGTSVMSIQFTRDNSHTLSIKNRYNHRVNNPDATYSNNLDNIISGLTKSFESTYGLIQKNKTDEFEIFNYVIANDGKYYKYNLEIKNIYYCPNNIIIDNFEVKRFDKEKYIVIDNFILDLQNKKILLYDKSEIDDLTNILENITSIQIKKIDKYKELLITNKDNIIKFLIDDNNCIIELESDITNIGNMFLHENKKIKKATLPKVKSIGNSFLLNNKDLSELNLLNVEFIEDYFLYKNEKLIELNIPNVRKIGHAFLHENEKLINLNIQNVQTIGKGFLKNNYKLKKLIAPTNIYNIYKEYFDIEEYNRRIR